MKAILAIVLASGILAVVPSGREIASVASSSGPMLTNRASFDGRRLLLASWDGATASLWDVETGLRIQEFVGHTEGVRAVALSPDGRHVLTGAGNTAYVRASRDSSVRLWDIASGQELRRFDGTAYRTTYPDWRGPVSEVAFSENGREVLGVGAGRGLVVWDAETAQLLFQQSTLSSQSASSLRGALVMTRSTSHWVRIWDYRSGKMLSQIDIPGSISSSRWSPDASSIVVASGREVSTWNASTGQRLQTYVGHKDYVLDAMFSADGQRLVSASQDGTVRLWDRTSGRLLGQLNHDDGLVWRALISPDGRRILSEWSPRFYPPDRRGPYTSLWDVDSGREMIRLDQMQKPLGFSPDGRTIPVVYGPSFSVGCCRLDSLLDAETGQPIRRFQD